jgi:hypothetical protein
VEKRAEPHQADVREKLQQEPMFCFERAASLLPSKLMPYARSHLPSIFRDSIHDSVALLYTK